MAIVLVACAGPVVSPNPLATSSPGPTGTPLPSRIVHTGHVAVETGQPITLEELMGRIVFDDFEDVFAMDIDGSDVVKVAGDTAGPEFDGAWSPDGEWVVYRDSTRGINENDEIFVAAADGFERTNITNDPANDWGPDWSPDGSTIVFNSDRDRGGLRGYLVDPDGSNLRALDLDVWFEYPSFSPDGTQIVFESHDGSDYDVYVADLTTGQTRPLTDSPGNDGWPVWSPDGSSIAFSTEGDECLFLPKEQECWQTGEPDDAYRDVWVMDADGSNQRRVNTELAQFMAWSPDGRYLLVSGRALYVVRPDGSGRVELRADGIDRALGGIPDWR